MKNLIHKIKIKLYISFFFVSYIFFNLEENKKLKYHEYNHILNTFYQI